MEIINQITGEEIILIPKGRIDTTTSPVFQAELMKSFQKGSRVVVDFEEVEYISSAGLRVLLLGHKSAEAKSGYMKLIHMNEAVRDILDLTGFSNILAIE